MAPVAPLAVCDDPAVRARMERASAAAQVPLDVVGSVTTAGPWLRAPSVFVDATLAAAVVDAQLPRRERVVVVADAPMSAAAWRACVALGAERVLTADESDHPLVRLLADGSSATDPSGAGLTVGVVGACGGAGASVLAAAVALQAADSGRTAFLADLDRLGPGLPTLLGMEQHQGARWRDITAAHGRIAVDALRRALPTVPGAHGRVALIGDRPSDTDDRDPAVVAAVLDAARRAGNLAIVDLPRFSTAAADDVATRADLVVVVAPAEVRGCYGGTRLAPRLRDLGARLGLVVRGPSPSGIGPDDVAAALEIPLVAAMRPQPGLARVLDGGGGLGRRRGPLFRAAAAVLAQVGDRP